MTISLFQEENIEDQKGTSSEPPKSTLPETETNLQIDNIVNELTNY